MLSLLLLVCAGRPGLAHALDPTRDIDQYLHRTWDIEDGLPTNRIENIYQTSDGYLWFATSPGLVRFDGVGFEPFVHAETGVDVLLEKLIEDPTGRVFVSGRGGFQVTDEGLVPIEVPGDRDYIALVGPDGQLWVRSTTGTFVGQIGAWTKVLDDVGAPESPLLGTMAIIATGDDTVSIALPPGRLLEYEGGTLRRTRTLPIDPDQCINLIRRFFLWEDPAGRLWAFCMDRAYPLDDPTADPVHFPFGDTKDQPRKGYIGPDGRLWNLTTNGLYVFDGRGVSTYSTDDGLLDDDICAVLEDRHGVLWIGTCDHGLNRIVDGETTAFTEEDGLSDNQVRSIFEDREGSLWVGTMEGGLNQFTNSRFTTLHVGNGLVDDMSYAIHEHSDGSVWIGVKGGVTRLQGDSVTRYTVDDGLPGPKVTAFAEDPQGRLWTGTYGEGLAVFDGDRWRVPAAAQDLAAEQVRALMFDSGGRLWVGTMRNGLFLLEGGTWTRYAPGSGRTAATTSDILEDRAGQIWVTTFDGLVERFTGDGFEVAEVTRLFETQFLDIYEDSDGGLWLGSYGFGLLRYREGQMTIVPREAGLPTTVFSVREDAEGALWLSSNRGLFRVERVALERYLDGEPGSLDVQRYGRADGLRSLEFNGGWRSASCATRDGRLWFPTTGGVVVVERAPLIENEITPTVWIDELIAGDLSWTSDQLAQGEWELPRGSRNVEIRYRALTHLQPETVEYLYRLGDSMQDWVRVGGERSVFLGDLDAGPYRFQVTARNVDGVADPGGAEVAFVVRPRITQTPAFLAFCLGVGFLLGVGVVLVRLRRVSSRQKELESRVREQTEELGWAAEELDRLAGRAVRFGPYVIDGIEDDAGAVRRYLARRLLMGHMERLCRLRRLHLRQVEESQAHLRFLDEARLTIGLRHAGIVVVQDYGIVEDELFLEEEYVEGAHLQQVLDHHGSLDQGLVLTILVALAEVLAFVHEATDAQGQSMGLVHRALVPRNVFITPHGEVKLSGFGQAQFKGRVMRTARVDLAEHFATTTPEQILGQPLDHRADVFGLGVLGYQLLTGHRPFDSPEMDEIRDRIVHARYPSIADFTADVDPRVAGLVDQLLRSQPDQRPANCEEVLVRSWEIWKAVGSHADETRLREVVEVVPIRRPEAMDRLSVEP